MLAVKTIMALLAIMADSLPYVSQRTAPIGGSHGKGEDTYMLGTYPLGAYCSNLCNIAVVSAYRNFSLTVLERALASSCVGCTRA